MNSKCCKTCKHEGKQPSESPCYQCLDTDNHGEWEPKEPCTLREHWKRFRDNNNIAGTDPVDADMVSDFFKYLEDMDWERGDGK